MVLMARQLGKVAPAAESVRNDKYEKLRLLRKVFDRFDFNRNGGTVNLCLHVRR